MRTLRLLVSLGRPRPVLMVALLAAVLLALPGCTSAGGGDDTTASSSSTTSDGSTAPSNATPSARTATAVAPRTTALALGRRAEVILVPKRKQAVPVTMAVTSVQRGRMANLDAFVIGPRVRRSSVFYVHVRVKNTSRRDLGGQRVLLFGQVSAHRVVPPVRFGPSYPRCDDTPLPTPFDAGSTAKVCLVMIVPHHGRLLSVQWRGHRAKDVTVWRTR